MQSFSKNKCRLLVAILVISPLFSMTIARPISVDSERHARRHGPPHAPQRSSHPHDPTKHWDVVPPPAPVGVQDGASVSEARIAIESRLFHSASGGYVRTPGSVKGPVDTTAEHTQHNILVIESVGFDSTVRLRSAISGHYLCFSKQGFLKTMRKVKGVQCDLREHMTDPTLDPTHSPGPVTQFQSVFDADWFLGFNRRGQRLHGAKWKGKKSLRHLYSFVKVTVGVNDRGQQGPLVDIGGQQGPLVDTGRQQGLLLNDRRQREPVSSTGEQHAAIRDLFEEDLSKT